MNGRIKRVFTQSFVVVGAVIEQDGRFLLVKENKPGHPDHRKWNQPGGWVDLGEDPLRAVVREVREETGFEFTPTHILGIYSLVRGDLTGQFGPDTVPHPVKIIFTGEIEKKRGARFDSSEISEIHWFVPEEIDAMDEKTLRDLDIKREVRDCLAGKRYPLSLLTHTVQE